MAWRRRDGRASAAARRILPAGWGLARGCHRFAQRGAGRPGWPRGRAAPRAMDLSPCLHWVRTRLWRCGARRQRFCSKCGGRSPPALSPFPSPVPSPTHLFDGVSTVWGPATSQRPPAPPGPGLCAWPLRTWWEGRSMAVAVHPPQP